MPTGVVLWNHAIYARHLPREIVLKPGRNAVPAADWDEIKDTPRVKALLAAGSEGGISMADLRSDIEAKMGEGRGVEAINELPIAEAVAFVHGETDVARLKELQAKVRFPQVAIAVQQRLEELARPVVVGRRKKTED